MRKVYLLLKQIFARKKKCKGCDRFKQFKNQVPIVQSDKGNWVAICDPLDLIIAEGKTMEEAYEAAERIGCRYALITKTQIKHTTILKCA